MLHTDASRILSSAFSKVVGRAPSSDELAKVQAVAWLETLYGRGGQFAKLAQAGKFCWGALQKVPNADGSCPSGTSPGFDASNARCFYVFGSDESAANAFVGTLLTGKFSGAPARPSTVAALSGSPLDLANEMKAHGYFEATPDAYAKLVAANLSKATSGKGAAPYVYGINDDGSGIAQQPSGWTPPGQLPVGPGPSPAVATTSWLKSPLGLAAIATGLGIVAYTQRAHLKGLVRT